MNSKMASNMISFDCDNVTAIPVAAEAQVVCGFSAYMVIGKMDIKLFWIIVGLATIAPETLNIFSHVYEKTGLQENWILDRYIMSRKGVEKVERNIKKAY
jgi:hypothetical protein